MRSAALEAAIGAANATWCQQAVTTDDRIPVRYSPRWRDRLEHIYPQLMQQGLALTDTSHDIYQFGIANDASGFLKKTVRRAFPQSRVYAFDSMKGLPTAGAHEEAVQMAGWQPGMFDQSKRAHEVLANITRAIGSTGRGFKFIGGFYDDSLTDQLPTAEGMKPAAYVDIDCDLYRSTSTVFSWLYRHRLIVPGTLIGFDDWWVQPCVAGIRSLNKLSTKPEMTGEWRAHVQAAAEFGVHLECVAGACTAPPAGMNRCDLFNSWGPIMRVSAVGVTNQTHNSGFDMAPAEIQAALTKWYPCIERHKHQHLVSSAQLRNMQTAKANEVRERTMQLKHSSTHAKTVSGSQRELQLSASSQTGRVLGLTIIHPIKFKWGRFFLFSL
jgi:hypothetical protein